MDISNTLLSAVWLSRKRDELIKLKGTKASEERRLLALNLKKAAIGTELVAVKEAILVAQLVSTRTQQKVEKYIEDSISLAEASVFDNPYNAKLKFVPRRDKTEADLTFLRDGVEVEPKEGEAGFGAIDISGLGMRGALFRLIKPALRPTFLIDEGLKHLRGTENQQRAGVLLDTLSKELGFQFLITAEVNFTVSAGKCFNVELKNKVSVVTEA